MLRAKLKELGFGQYLPEEGTELVEELLRRFVSLSEVVQSHKIYQNMKIDLEGSRRRATELQIDSQAAAAEVRTLKERVKALKTEADLEKRTSESVLLRIELAEKKLRNTVLENAEVNRIKDDRIKALIEENNLLSITIDKFSSRLMHGGVSDAGQQPLPKRISEVQAICEEMKRDRRTVEKLELAFKKMEEKLEAYRSEAVDLRTKNDGLLEQTKILERDLKIITAEKLDQEHTALKQHDLYTARYH